ncbi:MAG: hypothetical protein AAGA03_04290 [Planctomycetota bacterium]
MPTMLGDLLVFVSVWLALAGWFLGSLARVRGAGDPKGMRETIYRFAWLLGSMMIAIHILGSYALVHHWMNVYQESCWVIPHNIP